MIAEITKRHREKQNMTLNAFGKALGVTRQAVFNWENGNNQPDKYWLVKIFLDHSDWRFTWALECLVEMDPDNWGMEQK